MSDEDRLRAIETLPDNTEKTRRDAPIDNDHSLGDAHREHQFSTTVSALEKEKTKRRSKPLLVFVLVLLIAVLSAVAGIVVYKASFDKNSSQTPVAATPTTPSKTTPKLTAKQTIALVTPLISGTSPDTGGVAAPPVKSAGYQFYVAPGMGDENQSVIARVITGSQAGIDAAKVAKELVDKGFLEEKFTAHSPDGTTYSTYTHADVACALENTEGSIPTANHVVSVACADMSKYANDSAKLKPFADLYLAATNDPAVDKHALLFIGTPKTIDSKTANYKTAQVTVGSYHNGQSSTGGFEGMFYQTPDKVWHYFMGAQNALTCDKYNTTDLKKAYLGQPCTDVSGNQVTVSL